MSDSSHISVTADRLDSSALVLTGNTESLYAFIVFDLKTDGPTVFEVPPGVMGPLDDHNFLFLADIGPTGQDQGKGGKYLLLPPDYEGDVPDGYFVVRSPTYANFSFIRANADVVGYGEKALEFYRENAKVYPLKTGPRAAHRQERHRHALELARARGCLRVRVDARDHRLRAGRGLRQGTARAAGLAGHREGQALRARCPDAADLRQGRRAGRRHVARDRLRQPRPAGTVYPNRQWESPYVTNNSTFYQNDYINLEARTTFHFTADGITPAMAAQMPEGKGSRYQTTYKDKDGNFLDGNKTYKLNMPPKVPVALFWAVTVYDPWTRCEIQSQPYPSISSQQDPPPTTNADGSIDIYFSTEKPEGVRRRTGSRPFPTRASSSTSATTGRSTPSTTRPGCPTMWSWWNRCRIQMQEGIGSCLIEPD